jgi:hypothetical protein
VRNYQKFFFSVTNWIDGGMNPRETYLIQQSMADIAAGIADLEQSLRNNGFTVTGSSYLGFRYFCYDKTNINQILAPNAQSYWQAPSLPPQFQGIGTPRNGWQDVNGIDRKPPPSDKPSRKSSKAGTQSMSLLTYLGLLVDSWQRDSEPKRWIDWLTTLTLLYQKGTVSPTQVYGFLAKVDFSSLPPKLPR